MIRCFSVKNYLSISDRQELDFTAKGPSSALVSEVADGVFLYSPPLKTIFQHTACIDKLYADSFYKVQKSSHSSFEVICCGS